MQKYSEILKSSLLVYIFHSISKRRTECYLDNKVLEFLQCYNEFQNYLIEDDELLNVQINLKLQNLLPQDIDNLIYFSNHERYQLHIFSINIHSFIGIFWNSYIWWLLHSDL